MQCSVSVSVENQNGRGRGDGREKHVRCDKSQECRWCFWGLYFFFIWMAGRKQGIYSVPHLKCRP